MSSSESNEDDYVPFGFRMLSINSTKPAAPVMASKVQEETNDLPQALQYSNLLTRVMEQLNRNKEEGEKLKLGLRVLRKASYVNIVKIAHQLNRQPEHLSHFLSKNLLTDGSINKEGQLVLNGSFLQSAIEKSCFM